MPYPLREYWNNLGLLQQGYLVVLAGFCMLAVLTLGYSVSLRFAKASSDNSTISSTLRRVDILIRAEHEVLILLALLAVVVSSALVLSEFDSVSLSKSSLSAIRLENVLRLPTQLTIAIFLVLTICKFVLWLTAGIVRSLKQRKRI